jgi:hypothetical protein
VDFFLSLCGPTLINSCILYFNTLRKVVAYLCEPSAPSHLQMGNDNFTPNDLKRSQLVNDFVHVLQRFRMDVGTNSSLFRWLKTNRGRQRIVHTFAKRSKTATRTLRSPYVLPRTEARSEMAPKTSVIRNIYSARQMQGW